MARQNLLYILVGAVITIALGVFIGLQTVNMLNPATPPTDDLAAARVVQLANTPDSPATLPPTVPPPTSTPIPPASTPTPTELPPTETTVPTPTVESTATLTVLIAATSTNTPEGPPADAPTQTDTTASETNATPANVTAAVADGAVSADADGTTANVADSASAAAPSADYVFGYIEARTECTLATNIVATLMTEWGWHVRTVPLADATAIFQGLAKAGDPAGWIDMTLCYADPDDRDLFFKYGGKILFIGDNYIQIDETKWAVLAYVSVPPALRFKDNCIWNFIKDLEFGNAPLQGDEAIHWLDENPAIVASWDSCAGLQPEAVVADSSAIAQAPRTAQASAQAVAIAEPVTVTQEISRSAEVSVTDTPADTASADESTKSSTAAVDYTFGYIADRAECTLATNVVATLMTEWGWNVQTVPLIDATATFQGLAQVGDPAGWIDMTLCYADPDDRDLFFKYGGKILFIGDGYAQIDETKWAALAYVSVPPALRFKDNCIWNFIKNLTFSSDAADTTPAVALSQQDAAAATWIETHPDLVAAWEPCAGRYHEVP